MATPPEDEDLSSLPPMDGDLDEEDPAEADLSDFEPDADEGDADPFDDAPLGGSLEEELDVQPEEGGWVGEAMDAEALDVGEHELDGEEGDLLSDAEASSDVQEDYDFGEQPSAADDGGLEGFDAEDEVLDERALPPMDADAEAETEDNAFGEALEDADDSPLRWDDRGWPLAARGPDALRDVRLLAMGPHGAMVVDASGLHLGATLRDVVRAALPDDVASVAVTAHRFWIRTRAGAIFWMEKETWQATAQEAIAIGAAKDDRLVTVGKDGSIHIEDRVIAGPAPARQVDAVTFDPLAVLVRDRGIVARSPEPWKRLPSTRRAVAVASRPAHNDWLALVPTPTEDACWLVRVGFDEEPRILAQFEFHPEEDDPSRLALAWDDGQKMAWIGASFGVRGYRMP